MTSTALHRLKARVLKAEIATRSAKNPSHVFDLADVFTAVDETGEIIVTDAAGTKVEGKSLTEFLDEMPKVRPDLFTVETTVTAGNPFARGPSYNVTEQMRLMRTSPDTARRFEAEAQKKA